MTEQIRSKILADLIECFEDVATDATIGVAVSGGSDSVAMLLALREALPKATLRVATVDHGLRPEAGDEARWVGALCSGLGIEHDILPITNLLLGSNLQARARAARYDALSEWGLGFEVVCLGHSQTDVAETFLIRLARGSGVDGLAKMQARWHNRGLNWARPLLNFSRNDLRCYLRIQGQSWCEDPSNDDRSYTRVQMRQIQPQLDELGLNTARLAKTAARMSSVQKALAFSLKTIRQAIMQIDFGDIVFDRGALAQLPSEYVEQMVAESLSWIGGQAYKPRNSALLRAISAKTTFSLHGCVLIPQPGNLLRISREYVAVAKVKSLCPALWDGRYFAPNHNKTYEIRALGAYGLSLCPDWRFDKIPRIALESSPSVWQNDQLISAPQAGFGQKDVLQVVPTPWE